MLPALFASAGPDVLDAPDAVYDAALESAPVITINTLMLAALIPVALPRSEDWGWMRVMAFVLTPFQAAGEEYLFRGWVLASVGSWFRRPVVGWIVGGLVSTAIFALAHGSLDVWILLDLGAFAAAAVWLTWRTGIQRTVPAEVGTRP